MALNGALHLLRPALLQSIDFAYDIGIISTYSNRTTELLSDPPSQNSSKDDILNYVIVDD